MATIRCFEDIKSWQRSRELVQEIYAISKTGKFAQDFSLRDQIRRAAVSILSNIAEGYERGGKKEFIQFLYVAKGSCAETRSQLYVALDQKYLSPEQFDSLSELCKTVSKLLAGMIEYLKKTSFEGMKFKAETVIAEHGVLEEYCERKNLKL
jgi:four helix bundle protein